MVRAHGATDELRQRQRCDARPRIPALQASRADCTTPRDPRAWFWLGPRFDARRRSMADQGHDRIYGQRLQSLPLRSQRPGKPCRSDWSQWLRRRCTWRRRRPIRHVYLAIRKAAATAPVMLNGKPIYMSTGNLVTDYANLINSFLDEPVVNTGSLAYIGGDICGGLAAGGGAGAGGRAMFAADAAAAELAALKARNAARLAEAVAGQVDFAGLNLAATERGLPKPLRRPLPRLRRRPTGPSAICRALDGRPAAAAR